MNQQTTAATLIQASSWRKSSYSQGANDCVEVAAVADWIGVRDSKLGATSQVLGLQEKAWRAFLSDTRLR